jgi:hypothetical protein
MNQEFKIIEVGDKYYKVNDDYEIIYEVYWNETFEDWTPVLWNKDYQTPSAKYIK